MITTANTGWSEEGVTVEMFFQNNVAHNMVEEGQEDTAPQSVFKSLQIVVDEE